MASSSGHQGTLFVNSDDELLMAKSAGMDRITYGSDPNADTFGEIAGNGPFLEFVFGGRDGHPYHVKHGIDRALQPIQCPLLR